MLHVHKLRCYVLTMGIDPWRTFDSLLITPSNREALRTIKRALGSGQTRPNVILVRGPHGSGKTHLLHAIAGWNARRSQRRSVRMFTSHDFASDCIERIRGGGLEELRAANTRFGSLLLVDELEDLARTPTAEDELHHQIALLLAYRGTAVLALSSSTPAHERRITRAMASYGRKAVVRWRAPALPTRIEALRYRLRDLRANLAGRELSDIARRNPTIPEARADLDYALLCRHA